jgi:hypothetical protein
MFHAIITDRGRAWLEEGNVTPTRRALSTLVSPQLEAANPRALFDVFCARLNERLSPPQSIDECRVLWRALCGDGAIIVRQSFRTSATLASLVKEVSVEIFRPRWGATRDEAALAPCDSEVSTTVTR